MSDPNGDSANLSGGFAFDSDRQYLGDVYAKALLGAADKEQVGPRMLEELESLLHDVFAKQPRFRLVLQSPRVAHVEKAQLLEKAFAGKMHGVLLRFLKVLARHGRLDCLPEITRSVRRLVNQAQGRVQVAVKSATPLDDKLRATILGRLEQSLGAAVELRTEIDPDVLGGLVIRIGDTVYDGSVANRLQRMRKDAVAKTLQAFRDALPRFTAN